MTLAELLEKDKNNLIQELEREPSPDHARDIMEREMDRILAMYNQENGSEETALAVSEMMQVGRTGVPLVDTIGENIIWTADEGRGSFRNRKSVLLTGGGMITALVSLVLMTGAEKASSILFSVVLILAGCLLSAFGGYSAVLPAQETGRGGKDKKIENHIDAGAVYRIFHGMMQIIDQNVEKREEQTTLPGPDESSGRGTPGPEDLDLYAELLEALYSGDEEMARSRAEDLKYFLHQKGIEAVDYSDENRSFFDVMPSVEKLTIRPALTKEGRLLRRGLAAGGR